MRLPHHLVRHASGVYHFRLIVPADLRGRVGLRVIKRSLRTRNPRAALLGALTLSTGYALAFANLRGAGMADFDVKKLVADITSGGHLRYEIDPSRGYAKTDGTAADHARLLEAVSAMKGLQVVMPNAVSGSPMPIGGLTVREMISHWETVEMPEMNPRTADTRLRILNDFAAHYGEKRPVGGIRRPDVAAWVAHLKGSLKNSQGTADGKCSHLKNLLDLAIRSGYYPEALGNPAEDAVKFTKADQEARAETHGWEAFSLGQLKTLFTPDNLRRTREPHTRRAFAIALFTGARVGEIAQLRVDNFEVVDGVDCMTFQGELKTKASKRRIPIHPELLRLGLLDWVKEQKNRGQVRLFPTVKLDGKSGKGNAISKGASKLLRTLDIRPKGENTRLGMHSFRDTVIQELQGSEDLKEERRRAYAGHASYEKQDRSSHKTAYMRAWTPQEIAAVFGGLTWGKWLDFDGLRTLLAQTDSDALLNKQTRKAKRKG